MADMTHPFDTVPTLAELYDHIWANLVRGAKDRKHGFHTSVVSTVRDGRPTGRVVVLRKAEPSTSTLLFHTDARSAKVRELQDGVGWTLYDRKRRLQVRAWGPGRVADRALTDARWAASAATSRKGYLATAAPGSPVDGWTSGFPEDLSGPVVPDLERTTPGRDHFAVVVTDVRRLEVLVIRRAGHIRAEFTAERDWRGQWLVP